MKEFLLGTNYWASHAGADMWRDWDKTRVEKDLEELAGNGIKVLRIFPNWRDFQPVQPLYTQNHRLREYRMADDRKAENRWYLDECMLERFYVFCGIAEKYGIKLIVGLITGWMSGRLYLPPALYGHNLYTDPEALYLQQCFVCGLVSRMKGQPAILAWDLGNECNCMDQAPSREAACSWTMVIVNAIRANDHTRPVISGMHSLTPEGIWRIQDQADQTDVLTTHPYPFWIEHGPDQEMTDYRTLIQATAQTQYYATLGGSPCLVEELGTMGPMICSEEEAAAFMKVNLWSNWANGSTGVLWWCAYDQENLSAPPYDWNMCERELGLMDLMHKPKPVLDEIRNFGEALNRLNLDLPNRKGDAVCILSRDQDQWGIAFMTYLLGKRAGLTIDFAWNDFSLTGLKDSPMYFLPSATLSVMDKRDYLLLKERVAAGSRLYLSVDDGFFSSFENLTGFHVKESKREKKKGRFDFKGKEYFYEKDYQIRLENQRATVLLRDEEGDPLLGMASFGDGEVWTLNIPLEKILLEKPQMTEKGYEALYKWFAADYLAEQSTSKKNPLVGLTFHEDRERDYVTLINYSGETQDTGFQYDKKKYASCRALYGDPRVIEPFSAAVVWLEHR